MTDLENMWTWLERHQPKPGYANEWSRMLKERTAEAATAAYQAAWETAKGHLEQSFVAEEEDAQDDLIEKSQVAAEAAWDAEAAIEHINKAEEK
jgi:hypothetical protein